MIGSIRLRLLRNLLFCLSESSKTWTGDQTQNIVNCIIDFSSTVFQNEAVKKVWKNGLWHYNNNQNGYWKLLYSEYAFSTSIYETFLFTICFMHLKLVPIEKESHQKFFHSFSKYQLNIKLQKLLSFPWTSRTLTPMLVKLWHLLATRSNFQNCHETKSQGVYKVSRILSYTRLFKPVRIDIDEKLIKG